MKNKVKNNRKFLEIPDFFYPVNKEIQNRKIQNNYIFFEFSYSIFAGISKNSDTLYPIFILTYPRNIQRPTHTARRTFKNE